MSQSHDSVISIISVLVLLVLIVLSTALYGGNAEQKAKINNNPILHRVVLIFNFSLELLESLTKIGLNEKKYSLSELPADGLNNNQVIASDISKNQKGLVAKILANINQAWEEGNQDFENTNNGSNTKSFSSQTYSSEIKENNISNFIKWRSLNNGAELILISENGREYKMFLPFRFLSK